MGLTSDKTEPPPLNTSAPTYESWIYNEWGIDDQTYRIKQNGRYWIANIKKMAISYALVYKKYCKNELTKIKKFIEDF